MRVALCCVLLAVSCKAEPKTAEPAPAGSGASGAPALPTARPRPTLPGEAGSSGRERPDGDDESPADELDPAAREQLRAQREERRRHRDAMLDTDHDGVVSPAERQARLRPMVERLDRDGDGRLSVDELASRDRRMGFDDPAAIDTDHDGQISLAELDAAVTARREQLRARWRGPGGGSANLPPE